VGVLLHEVTVASAILLYEDRRGEESSCWCTSNHKVVLSPVYRNEGEEGVISVTQPFIITKEKRTYRLAMSTTSKRRGTKLRSWHFLISKRNEPCVFQNIKKSKRSELCLFKNLKRSMIRHY
jgi:hypothetical protein